MENENERFYQLRKLAEAAFNSGDFTETKTLAEEYLALAAQQKGNWNYGNAIHHANIFLGRIALQSGNVDEAKSYLLKAGRTPGSPQLNSFGPNMALAKELLERGEREVVMEYINLCKRFWYFIFRAIRTWKWKRQIRKGEIPDFGPHLIY